MGRWRLQGSAEFASPDEIFEVLLSLKEAGIDVFHASIRRFWLPEFEGSDLNLAGWTREITESPTITVGNIGLVTEEFYGDGQEGQGELMRRFDRGEFDMVAVGRPLLSEPAWVNKVRDGLQDEIAPFTYASKDWYP